MRVIRSIFVKVPRKKWRCSEKAREKQSDRESGGEGQARRRTERPGRERTRTRTKTKTNKQSTFQRIIVNTVKDDESQEIKSANGPREKERIRYGKRLDI